MADDFSQYMPPAPQPTPQQGQADFGQYMSATAPQQAQADQNEANNTGPIDKVNAFGAGVASSVGLGPDQPLANAVNPNSQQSIAGQAQQYNPNTAMAGKMAGSAIAGSVAGAIGAGVVGSEAAGALINNFTSSALFTDGGPVDKIIGGAVGVVAGKALSAAGSAIKGAVQAGTLGPEIQSALDTISTKLFGKTTNEAGAQTITNTYNTAVAQADKDFANFRNVPGKVSGLAIANNAQRILNTYGESLNPLQKQVLKNTITGANDVENIADLHAVRKIISGNYTKFTGNVVTQEMGQDLRGLAQLSEDHIKSEADAIGAGDLFSKANSTWKGTILPLRSYGFDDVAHALDPANAAVDPKAANQVLDNVFGTTINPGKANDINGLKSLLNPKGREIVDSHIINKVFGDTNGEALPALQVEKNLKTWGPTFKKVLDPESMKTVQGLIQAVSTSHVMNKVSQMMDSHMAQIGFGMAGGLSAESGHYLPIAGAALMYGVRAMANTPAGQTVLKGLSDVGGTKAAYILGSLIKKGASMGAAQQYTPLVKSQLPGSQPLPDTEQ